MAVFFHPRCRCHPSPEVPPMLYYFWFPGLPLHPQHGRTHVSSGAHQSPMLPDGDWVALDYRPAADEDNALLAIVAGSGGGAKKALAEFYGAVPPVNWLRASWSAKELAAPPPDDWPFMLDPPAAVCPECGNTGRVLLFTGYSDCSLCRPRG